MLYILQVPEEHHTLHQVALTNAELMDIFKCADQFPGSSQGSDIPHHTHYAGSSQHSNIPHTQPTCTHSTWRSHPSKIPHSQPTPTHSARSSQPSLTQPTNSAGSFQQSSFPLPTHSTVPNSPITEEQIFQRHSYIAQIWKLTLLPHQPGRSPTCSGCRQKVFKEQEVHIAVCGLYIPKNATFCVPRTFRFCLNPICISHKPIASNLTVPPTRIIMDPDMPITREHISMALNFGIDIE